MAGYNGYSKSNNAIEAEQENKFPASILAKKIKTSTEAVKEYMSPCEWHHTSSMYNRTDYYDGEILLAIVNNSDLSIYDVVEVEEARKLLEKMKSYKKKINESEYVANIEYIEWSGTRNYPKKNVYKFDNVKVIEKGCFYNFEINGIIIKKKIGSNGTIVKKVG